jgi:hypothetical protein
MLDKSNYNATKTSVITIFIIQPNRKPLIKTLISKLTTYHILYTIIYTDLLL